MPRVTFNQTNFTTGELSPKAGARVDIDRYPNAVERMENCIPLVQGGARSRPGTKFIAAAKYADKACRLIPFILNKSEAYQLEFGDLYVRFYKGDAQLGAPYEIVSPYTAAQVQELDFIQRSGEMYIAHRDVPIYRLRRFADTNWDLSPIEFYTEPFAEQGIYPNATLTLSATTVGAGRTATASAAVFLVSDIGRAILYGAGKAVITGFTSTTVVTVQITAAFGTNPIAAQAWNLDISPQTTLTPSAKDPVGASITLNLTSAGWRTEDVGKFVQLNGGLVRITSLDGANPTTIANATIVTALNAATAVPPLAWSLEDSQWNARNGYPRTLTLHQQRLIAAGSSAYPQTLWFSRIGEPFDFTLGLADDDAFKYNIESDENNEVAYLSSDRDVIVLTYGGEFTAQGGVEKPITPTSIQVKAQSSYGARDVRPIQIGSETMFVQRAGLKIRAMNYQYANDRYDSADISVLAEHLMAPGLLDLAYWQEPYQLLVAIRSDGVMITSTFDRSQSVIGWVRHYTDGAIESISVIPTVDSEQLWASVRRVVGGASVRYIERFEPDFVPVIVAAADPNVFPPADPPTNYGYTVDAAVAKEDALGFTSITGLSHLNGKTVSILADGLNQPTQVVSAGAVTLARTAYKALVGLPFTPRVKTLTPEIGTQTGSAQGNSMRTAEVTLRFLDTIGCSIDGQQVTFRNFGTLLLDQPAQPFTGEKRIEKLGWERGSSPIDITQPYPLPLHLLSVIRQFTVNSG